MLQEVSVEKVLKSLMSGGGEYGEIFIESRETTTISHEDNRIERVIKGSDKGIGIRLIRDFKTFYGWTNSFEESDLLEISSRVASLSKQDKELTLTLTPLTKISPEWEIEIYPGEFDFQGKIDLVKEAREGASVSPLIQQVRVNYFDSLRRIQIANSCGEFFESVLPHVIMAVQAVASREGKLQIGYESEGGTRGIELFHTTSPGEIGRKAGIRAEMMVRARKAPSGKMPVVLSSYAGGTMIHEAVGHGLEADLATGGLSVYMGRIGEEIASHLVTVVDDPTLGGKRGSYPLDDEGVPPRRNILIEKGVLKNYMFDRLHAMKEETVSTGNGRRESYRHRPIPRMSNTMIRPGDAKPEEIVRSTHRGLLVKKMGGGKVNTVTGDFMFEVAEGYVIEGGKIGEAVRGATLTGNGPEVLKMIDRVGNDLGFAIGTCGKDGQGVPVADAQPTLRIGEPFITVGGSGGS